MSLYDPSFALLDVLAAVVLGYVAGRLHAAWRDPGRVEARRQSKLQDMLSARDRFGRLSPEMKEMVATQIAEGRLVEAVKNVRTALGCGLKEAKDVVDLAAGK